MAKYFGNRALLRSYFGSILFDETTTSPDGLAPGAVVTSTVSVIPGSAIGSSFGEAAGAVVVTTVGVSAGGASGTATAPGVLLTAIASVIAGSASGSVGGDPYVEDGYFVSGYAEF